MASKDKGGGGPQLSVIAGSLDQAKPAPKVGRKRQAEGEEIQNELPLLPHDCPVEPLGKLGQLHFYLDEQKQMISLDPQKHGKTHILALFGRRFKLVHQYWPRYSDKTGSDGKPIVTGWKPEVAAETLMGACAMQGIFDPQGKVRGTGAHRSADGELILHCGDKIFITGPHSGYVDPGLIAGYVYPAGPSRPRPFEHEIDTTPGELLLVHLKAWHWMRPLVDPMLALGWIGCAMVGGALDWRPHAWITGSTATGKSTLQKLIRELFNGAALTTGNATEASLRQLLKQQTLPVLFDELEAQEDNRKNTAVIELARLASSGEQALRGGQNHEGHEFTVRSCFLFSSILLPPMPVQDKNRLAILELERIPPGKAAPTIVEAELRELGRKIRRRLVDQWHRVDELVSRYKIALGNEGHSGRSGDQFGTLLAIADILLYDVADEENILEWASRLKADTLEEKSTEIPDEQEAVHRLATSFIQQRGGEEPQPVVRHIQEALSIDGDKARERLENFGLRIVEIKWNDDNPGAIRPRPGTPPTQLYLAIARNHVALAKLFAETRWSGGTWSQSFGRVTAEVEIDGQKVERKAIRRVKVRMAGQPGTWATAIPLPAIIDFEKPTD
jgi:hypothetical protein